MIIKNLLIPRSRNAMLSLDQLRRRLAEKGYRHGHAERLLREVEGPDIPPEVLDQMERFLTADCDRIFRLWFGDRDYKKHLNLATVDCAQGGIRSILDYVKREG